MNKRIIKLIIEKHRPGHDMKIATYTYRYDEVSRRIYRCKTSNLTAAWPNMTKNKPCDWEYVTTVDFPLS